jgi:hypothetical protein
MFLSTGNVDLAKQYSKMLLAKDPPRGMDAYKFLDDYLQFIKAVTPTPEQK